MFKNKPIKTKLKTLLTFNNSRRKNIFKPQKNKQTKTTKKKNKNTQKTKKYKKQTKKRKTKKEKKKTQKTTPTTPGDSKPLRSSSRWTCSLGPRRPRNSLGVLFSMFFWRVSFFFLRLLLTCLSFFSFLFCVFLVSVCCFFFFPFSLRF